MSHAFSVIKWVLALGREPQHFLGARWVTLFLARVPERSKRLWALRMLSLSPHYFYIEGETAGLNNGYDAYLEAAFQANRASREKLTQALLTPFLAADMEVLDYGCGPGYFARAVAPRARKVFACDISTGALACARILNPAPNIEYVLASPEGFTGIPDGSLGLVFSFAVAQHVTDAVFLTILQTARAKLKPGGKLAVHIVCGEAGWRSEADWKANVSLRGKLRYRYGLHCFSRTEEQIEKLFASGGFTNAGIHKVSEFINGDFDDICRQHWVVAEKTL